MESKKYQLHVCGTLCNEFGLSQNIAEFHLHSRVIGTCLKFLISKFMVVYAQMELGNTTPQNLTDNPLLVYDIVLYVVNEKTHKFNLSKKTVHTVIMRALGALKEGKPRVNGSLKFKQLLLTLIGIKMQVVIKNFIRYTRINSD